MFVNLVLYLNQRARQEDQVKLHTHKKALESASYEVWYMHVLNFVECVSVLCMPSNIVVKTHA